MDIVRALVVRASSEPSSLLLCDNAHALDDTRRETALTYAVGNGHLDVVECLLRAEADMFHGGHANVAAPTHKAAPGGWTKLLNDHPAWIPPAHVACYEGRLEMIGYFVEELGISVDSKACPGKFVFCRYRSGANEITSEGTLLHFVLINKPRQDEDGRYLQCVKYLLDNKADVTIQMRSKFESKSALDIAWESDFTVLALMAWKLGSGRLRLREACRIDIGPVNARMREIHKYANGGHDVSPLQVPLLPPLSQFNQHS